MDENLFVKLIDYIEGSDELNDEDKDLLRKLTRKAVEIESKPENSN